MSIRSRIRSLLPRKAPSTDYLRQQVRTSWAKESRNLQWFGLRDGLDILDLGCGPGYFTESLAELLPNSRITAIDTSSEMLTLFREREQRHQITILQTSAEQTGLAADSFDFAIARLLFQHLPQPSLVLQEAMRVLRPGGKLVLIDSDDGLFGLVEPPVPGLDRLLDHYGQAQAERGGNRRIGRWLPRLLRDAGFSDVELDIVVSHSDTVGLDRIFPQLDPAPLDWLARTGRLTPEEHAAYGAARRDLHAAADPFAMVLLFMACGTRRAIIS